MSYSIEEINRLDRKAFVELLGDIYEETPAVADRLWRVGGASPAENRPFKSVADLHKKMAAVVEQMSEFEQLTLIRAHPELGANVNMAEASVREQADAGLDQMSKADRDRLMELNAAYQSKFGFPFVMAVKGYGKTDILTALGERLENSKDEERERSLFEIHKIARLRLEAFISD